MLAILNSLNAHNFPIFNRFWLYLYQNSWFIEFFLINPFNLHVSLMSPVHHYDSIRHMVVKISR